MKCVIGHYPDLVPQQPHQPAGDKDAAHEHCETLQTIADLLDDSVALGDAKDDRREEGKQHGGSKVGQMQVHDFFPNAM